MFLYEGIRTGIVMVTYIAQVPVTDKPADGQDKPKDLQRRETC